MVRNNVLAGGLQVFADVGHYTWTSHANFARSNTCSIQILRCAPELDAKQERIRDTMFQEVFLSPGLHRWLLDSSARAMRYRSFDMLRDEVNTSFSREVDVSSVIWCSLSTHIRYRLSYNIQSERLRSSAW